MTSRCSPGFEGAAAGMASAQTLAQASATLTVNDRANSAHGVTARKLMRGGLAQKAERGSQNEQEEQVREANLESHSECIGGPVGSSRADTHINAAD